MAFIQTPFSLEGGSPSEGFGTTLRRYLTAELQQHRTQVVKYDLSGFDGQNGHALEMTFGAPRWQMEQMANRVAQMVGKTPEEVAATTELVINRFVDQSKADGWEQTINRDGVTVTFRENFGDESHPANPPRIENAQGQMAYPHNVGFASINGRPVTMESRELLPKSLPAIAKWLDAVKEVERDGVMDFNPVVALEMESNASISATRTLHIGGELLTGTDDKSVMTGILRHERGHVINGDFDLNSPETRTLVDTLTAAEIVQETLETIKGYAEKPRAIESADTNKDLALIRQMGDALSQTMAQMPQLADTIKSYKGYDDLSPQSVAAEAGKAGGLLSHLQSAEKIDVRPLQEAMLALKKNARANPVVRSDYENYKLSKGEEGASWGELRQALKRQLARITPEQHEALQEVGKSSEHVSKSKEHLADMHAVLYSANPEDVRKIFTSFGKAGLDESGGRTHPVTENRAEVAQELAARFRRDNPKRPQPSNPKNSLSR